MGPWSCTGSGKELIKVICSFFFGPLTRSPTLKIKLTYFIYALKWLQTSSLLQHLRHSHWTFIAKFWVSWKQRPLRPQNLKTKTPPYFGGLQNYEPVINVTESWALATRILRLLLASWTGIRGIGFVLNRKTLCFVSSKKLTTCLFEAFNFHRKQFRSKLKVWLLSISPKTVIIHPTM